MAHEKCSTEVVLVLSLSVVFHTEKYIPRPLVMYDIMNTAVS